MYFGERVHVSTFISIDSWEAYIPQMITPSARMCDGIRPTRINKFAKALLLYSGAQTLWLLFRYIDAMESRFFYSIDMSRVNSFLALSMRHPCEETRP